MPEQVERLLTENDAAKILDVKPNTLAIWRMTGRHNLPYVRVGRNIRYRMSHLIALLDCRTVHGAKVAKAGS
jgi:Helix-turn-helix domain